MRSAAVPRRCRIWARTEPWISSFSTSPCPRWTEWRRSCLLKDAVIVSDDAGQFNVGSHALCWVHAERLIHKLVGFNHRQRQACARIRARVWWFYADLKAYCRDPTPRRKREQARFDRRSPPPPALPPSTGCSPGKVELLRIPLHTNGSISETGRDCRDAFLGLMKATSSASRSGTTSAAGSTSPARHPSSPCQTSSASAPDSRILVRDSRRHDHQS